jgi:adenosylcobinamide-GDP ribazoletransferase
MRGFWLALGFLTRLPTPRRQSVEPGSMARAAVWFPAVGLIVGAVVAASAWFGSRIDPWLGALLALLAWVGVTGGLHLDGLADLADALGAAHRDRDRLLAVLADPHLGAFGAIALVLQLLAKAVLLMLACKLGVSGWVLVLLPAWARLGALWWAQSLPPLKPGLGQSFAWTEGRRYSIAWLLVLLALAWLAPVLAAMPLVLLGWRQFLSARVGGMTGDCLGAGIEVSESVGLLLVCASAAV